MATRPGLDEIVDEEDIAQVVAKWTGIPLSKMMQTESEKLLNMEDRLHERIVGQDEAIRAISDAIRRARSRPCRPEATDRLFCLPGADWRWQDCARPSALPSFSLMTLMHCFEST